MIAQTPDTQIFSTSYPIMYKANTRYHAISEIDYGLFAYIVNKPLALKPLAKASG